jgi:hypothetical protein
MWYFLYHELRRFKELYGHTGEAQVQVVLQNAQHVPARCACHLACQHVVMKMMQHTWW